MLCHFLAPHPSRLYVKHVHDVVFVVTVSTKKFFDALVIVGELRIANVRLVFHPSLASAMRVVSRLPRSEQNRALPFKRPATMSMLLPTALCRKSLPLTPPHPRLSRVCLGTFPENLLRVPASPFNAVPGMWGAARRRVAYTAAATGGFTPHRPHSYLEAALSPQEPPTLVCQRPLPLPTSMGCFRCLATDHQVDDCRDPIRCRSAERLATKAIVAR